MDNEKLSDGELISQVRLRGLKPSQVFRVENLVEDEDVRKKMDAEVDYKLWLRDKESEEELKKMDKEIEENELKDENNPFIPGPDPEDKPKEKKEEKKKKSENEDTNPFIPDLEGDSDDDSGEGEENPFIPD